MGEAAFGFRRSKLVVWNAATVEGMCNKQTAAQIR